MHPDLEFWKGLLTASRSSLVVDLDHEAETKVVQWLPPGGRSTGGERRLISAPTRQKRGEEGGAHGVLLEKGETVKK